MEDYNPNMYTKKYHTDDISKYSFLITGGAGFIGSNIVEYLLQHGAGKVRVLDNFSTGFRQNLAEFASYPNLEIIEDDIRNPETCRKAVEGIDYISHQAALGSVPRSINDPIATNSVNISGFLNMLVAAKDAGVKRMIYAASSSTYGDSAELPKKEERIGKPLSPYAVTKYVNELYAEVFSNIYQFHTIGLRYFNVFGPKQSPSGAYAAVVPLFIQSALEGSPAAINGDGFNSRDFTFVGNAVQANIKALFVEDFQKHEVINIACGAQTTLNELWSLVCKLTGLKVPAQHRPERTGDVKFSLADISKAGELINYQPEYDTEKGVEIALNWYREKQLETSN